MLSDCWFLVTTLRQRLSNPGLQVSVHTPSSLSSFMISSNATLQSYRIFYMFAGNLHHSISVFEITSHSGASPNLPFVFLLSLSSPISNYVTATYSRLFLSLLRIRTITAPFGRKILQEFWLKVYIEQVPHIVLIFFRFSSILTLSQTS